jgi:hypothetical protein
MARPNKDARRNEDRLDEIADEVDEPKHHVSITEVTGEAARTGLAPIAPEEEEIPGEDDVLRAGDPDDDPMQTEYSGENAPGGGNSTPDHNQVDDIGRTYGITEADDGELKLGDDLIEPRDQERWELDPRSKDREK